VLVDCEGHVEDERVADALIALHRVSPLVRFVGSYPRPDGVAIKVGPATSDAAFTQARSWLRRLREGGLA
jgi:prephenate dehydratase